MTGQPTAGRSSHATPMQVRSDEASMDGPEHVPKLRGVLPMEVVIGGGLPVSEMPVCVRPGVDNGLVCLAIEASTDARPGLMKEAIGAFGIGVPRAPFSANWINELKQRR